MRILAIFIAFLFFTNLSAQEKFSDRIYFGGGFGLSAGSNVTNVSLSPQVGYKITDRFSAGFGLTYQYVKFKQVNTSISNYGWSVFTRYNLTRQFFAYSEFERLNFEFFPTNSIEVTQRTGYNSLLVGAGYSESLSGRASFSIMALYNVLYDANEVPQPYNSPWVIRAGVGLGLF